MLRNVGRDVIVKGGKDSSLDCALFNIYRRSKELSETKTIYGLKAFKAIVLDEFSYKYKGTRWQKYEKDVNEMRSLCYYRRERGLHHINPSWLPPLQ